MTREIPAEINIQLTKWKQQGTLLRLLHAFLGVAATLCSLLVAAKINSFEKINIEWLAVSAAISTGLLSAFDLGSKANRMRRAWRRLNAARLRFELDPDFTVESLINVYEESEEIIGDVKEEPK